MKFTETGLAGAYLVEQTPFEDERGAFGRAYCVNEFSEHGLDYTFVQANMSRNVFAGTMRGLHYQDETAPEAKFFRCINGAVYDVIMDMRPDSPTFLKSFGVELTADNRLAVLVPPLFAHGYLSLTAGAEVFYQTSHVYVPGVEKGVRFNDPLLNVEWPMDVVHVSEKDLNWPDINLDTL